MKKIILICLSAILVFALFGCGNQTTADPKETTAAPQQSTAADATAAPQTAPAQTQAPTTAAPVVNKTLTPAEAVKIYQDNASLWQKNPDEFYMGGYFYLFLDLDFDGVLELVTTEVQGTGRYSTNKYYKINLADNSVEEITSDKDKGESSIDYYMDDSPELYKNKTTGEYLYIGKDYIRAGGGMDFTAEKTLALKDGVISETSLFSYERIDAAVSSNGETQEIYRVYSLENNEVDKATYDNERASYFADYIDADLDTETIDGGDYSNATDADKFELLLDSYTEFSYDGFEFED